MFIDALHRFHFFRTSSCPSSSSVLMVSSSQYISSSSPLRFLFLILNYHFLLSILLFHPSSSVVGSVRHCGVVLSHSLPYPSVSAKSLGISYTFRRIVQQTVTCNATDVKIEPWRYIMYIGYIHIIWLHHVASHSFWLEVRFFPILTETVRLYPASWIYSVYMLHMLPVQRTRPRFHLNASQPFPQPAQRAHNVARSKSHDKLRITDSRLLSWEFVWTNCLPWLLFD